VIISLWPFKADNLSSSNMLIINIKDNESIDRALKRYKKKFERTGRMRELRARTAFQKPSVTRRQQRLRAIYKEKMYGNSND